MEKISFKDHFSKQSELYAQYRPKYPKALFDWLNDVVKSHDCAWDCATGNGQAAIELAKYFRRVIATDGSAKQIENAVQHERIEYHVATAEKSGLPDHSADLVTVAAGIHWFDFDPFYKEVRRVGKPHSVLAAWTYDRVRIHSEIDAIINRFYDDIIGAYWPAGRQFVDERYATIPFPFDEIKAPALEIVHNWTADEFIGYLLSWSSVQRYISVNGRNPIDIISDDLKKNWGNGKRKITWPLFIRAGAVEE